MQKNDKVQLQHILDAAHEAVGFLRNRSRNDLDNDRMLNLSLIRLLEIIGEAARGVSPEFRSVHSELAWKQMIGMRDRLIHGYFDINLDVVWETIKDDLPTLIVQMENILFSEE